METMKNLFECHACPQRISHEHPVLPDGEPKKTRLVVVYRRASREDALLGLSLMDPAGQLLREVIVEAGYFIDRVYFTASVKCAPAAGIPLAKVKCGADCRKECISRWLNEELQDIPHDIPICVLGHNTAIELLTNCRELSGRPLYTTDAESTLLTGGRPARESFKEFFRRLEQTH